MRQVKSGFTIIELLVSLVLVGVLLVVTTGLLFPFKLTRDSSYQTSAVAISQSYLELLKSKWLDDAVYTAMSLPVVCKKSTTNSSCDITIDDTWKLQIKPTILAAWTATDSLRPVVVEAILADGKVVSFSTMVAKP